MADREEFVVDASGVSSGRMDEVCRFALGLVARDAHTFQTDIPLSQVSQWPDPVKRAAKRLERHATGRRSGNPLYKTTGVVVASDRQDWDALVCFAPHAFDATVWATDQSSLVSLADEGTSLVVALTSAQRTELEGFDEALRLVPVREWRRR